MQYAFLGLALAASVYGQGVGDPQYPPGVNGPPPKSNYPKNAFILQTVNISDAGNNQAFFTNTAFNCTNQPTPKIALIGSAMIDEAGSTGSVVANDQFQFDGPPQAGVKVSAGWYRNDNATLAYGSGGDSAVFYQCNSGDIKNLYRTSLGEQCYPIFLLLNLCTASSSCGVRYDAVNKTGTPIFQIPSGAASASLDAGPSPSSSCVVSSRPAGVPGASAVSVAVSSSPAAATTQAASSAATPTSVAAVQPATMLMAPVAPASTPVATSAPAATQASVAAAPAAGNGTVPAGTSAAKPPATTSPAPFTNAAPAIAVGQKAIALLAVVAGAFALA